MGSIVSFPVLCIANAAVVRWALEIDKKRVFSLQDAPMMINGDDCAARCTKRGLNAWRMIADYAGLKESVGKTYFSSEFVEINSTQFRRDEVTPHEIRAPSGALRSCPFHLTRYVNMGLLVGLKRSGLKVGLVDQDDPRNNLGTRYREMLRLCPLDLQENVHNRFLHNHRRLLTSMRLPWYIPEWIGGVGLTGLKEPSELDLRIAQKILFQWNKRKPVSLAHAEAPWKVWQLAEERVPTPFTVTRKSEEVDRYTAWVAMKCVDLLFDSSLDLEDIFKSQEVGRSVVVAIRRNERLWNVGRGSDKGLLPQPIDPDKLVFRTRYSAYKAETLLNSNVDTYDPQQLLDLTGLD